MQYSMLNELKRWFGNKCSGIKVNGEAYSFLNVPSRQLRFCEALSYSFTLPILLNEENLLGPGARRTVGFYTNHHSLGDLIAEKKGIPASSAWDLVKQTPVIRKHVSNLILGITEDLEECLMPDIYIIYTQPERIMYFVHSIPAIKKMKFVSPSSLLSICGNVFARAFQSHEVSISFGCQESREYGSVKDDEVIMGIPYKLIKEIQN